MKLFVLLTSLSVFACGGGHSSDASPTTPQDSGSRKDPKPEVTPTPGTMTQSGGSTSNGGEDGNTATTNANNQSGGANSGSTTATPVPTVSTGGDNTVVIPGETIVLPEEGLKLSNPFEAWILNAAKVTAGAPKTVSKTFTIHTAQPRFISFSFEHKSTRDCLGAFDFDYAIMVSDANSSGIPPRPFTLNTCIELAALKDYKMVLTMTNSKSCDSLGLEFAISARTDCRPQVE